MEVENLVGKTLVTDFGTPGPNMALEIVDAGDDGIGEYVDLQNGARQYLYQIENASYQWIE